MKAITAAVTEERWRPVAGFEETYEVSDQGRVRSLARIARHGRRVRECILKPSAHPGTGHLRVGLFRDGLRTTHQVHRLVAFAFLDDPAPGHEVCHGDGDPTNNAVENLRWGTRSENMLDSIGHGAHNSARKTHCPIGHPLAGSNLVPAELARGKRGCLSCDRARGLFGRRPKPDAATFQIVADGYFARLEHEPGRQATEAPGGDHG